MRALVHLALGLVAALAAARPALSQNVQHSLQVTRLTASSTARHGGSDGSPYNLSCSEGDVLVGVNARAGQVVDRVQGICTSITAAGAWTGSLENTGSTGGSGGNSVTRTCPSGFALSGFSGSRGSFLLATVVQRLVLECTRLGPNGTFDTSVPRQNLAAIGPAGGTAFGTTRCDRPARAIAGRSGTVIDSFELACENDSPLMTRAQIDTALSGASGVLQQDSGAGDVACAVDLSRSGRVRIEPSNGLFTVSSQEELSRACDLLGFAVVANGITFCSGPGTNIIGCARPGCMIVIPGFTGSSLNQLWAHEFGHTRALPHRDSSTSNVMFSSLSGGDRINSAECDSYRSPLLSLAFSFLPAEAATDGGERMGLEDFVSRQFVHGLPYAEALAYGPEAVPKLIAILKDPAQEAKWANAAVMLGMIGDARGVDAVISFVKDPGPGELTWARSWARNNAVMGLGYSAHGGRSKKALQYLEESLQPDAWKKRGVRGVRGSPPVRERGADAAELDAEDDVDGELTEYAVMGLVLSATPEATGAIEAYRDAPGRSERQRQMLNAGLAEQAKIAAQGLAAFDRERHARLREAQRSPVRPRGEEGAGEALPADEPPPPDRADGGT